jgi:aspartyl-tRNA(Asn)/glutamyl-tRNA(Gln) amidotransferase subunit B
VVQETRHFDEIRNITVSIRSKVGAHDYRYFPEPDLVPLRVAEWVPKIMAELPELPDAKRQRFVAQYGLTDEHAKSLTSEIKVANFYEAVAAKADHKMAAVWVADVLKGELNYRDLEIESFKPEDMASMVNMLSAGKITEDVAVQIIRTILDKGGSPEEIVNAHDLGKAGDEAVAIAVRETLAECQAAIADCKNGNPKAMNFIVGQVMKKTNGRAKPTEVHKLVKEAMKNV